MRGWCSEWRTGLRNWWWGGAEQPGLAINLRKRQVALLEGIVPGSQPTARLRGRQWQPGVVNARI